MSGILGVVIAGGQSTRYGSPKALADVGGERVVDRVMRALSSVTDQVVAIVNDDALAEQIGVPSRTDRSPGLGPLAGFDAALAWAAELGRDGILAAGCDMPFLSEGLLELIAARALESGADGVLPESRGPRGVEPLVAYYSVSCIPAIAAAIERGDHRLIAFHNDVAIELISLSDVSAFGDPDHLFMNMNSVTDRDRADAIVRGAGEGGL